MKKWIYYGLLLGQLFVIAVSIATPAVQTPAETKEKLLIVLEANNATIIKSKKNSSLILYNLNPKTLYFTDRPVRKAGFMITEKFLNTWLSPGSTLRNNPPNASIVFYSAKQTPNNLLKAIAVELKNPIPVRPQMWKFQLKDLEGKLAAGNYHKVVVFLEAPDAKGMTLAKSP